MSFFLNGPAHGIRLMLGRAPLYLRVTFDDAVEPAKQWDALDQWEDTPKETESIYAYKREGEPVPVHMNFGGGKGGFYKLGNYNFIDPQPTDAEMRTNAAWIAWVNSVHARKQKEPSPLPIVACKSCGASIIWLMTAKDKRIPVDATDAVKMHESALPGRAPTVPLFDSKAHVSHFATCPNAERHRKKKQPQPKGTSDASS